MKFHFDYASTSALRSTRNATDVRVATALNRQLRFHGRVVKHLFPLRIALRALGEAIWSQDDWLASADILDPVITVHSDQILLEAFSRDGSAYASLAVDPDIFETAGTVTFGTTNIDFSTWLWGALAEMRSSRDTWFHIGPDGMEVATTGGGSRFQPKVDVPDAWVRGFLEVQAAMAMPGTRFTARPVDLLAVIRFLRYNKAKLSPRALRYLFLPDEPVAVYLEPWEEKIVFKGSSHSYSEEHSVRQWGRRRLRVIEPLLPCADNVRVYLKGRARPSFFVVQLPGMKFTLGISDASSNQGWMKSGHSLGARFVARQCDDARKLLIERTTASSREVAEVLSVERRDAENALIDLCRRGEAVYELETRQFRHRQLFSEPIDLAAMFPPDIRSERAAELLAGGSVRIRSLEPSETRKFRKLKTPSGTIEREVIHRDWVVAGSMDGQDSVEITISDSGRIIFGRCGCDHFRENLLNHGPCEHMLALFESSADACKNLPTSVVGSAPPPAKPSPFDREALDNDDDDE
ncbi:MAG: SWIM zinc finger family protein [Verrucomicrobiales bacterium]